MIRLNFVIADESWVIKPRERNVAGIRSWQRHGAQDGRPRDSAVYPKELERHTATSSPSASHPLQQLGQLSSPLSQLRLSRNKSGAVQQNSLASKLKRSELWVFTSIFPCFLLKPKDPFDHVVSAALIKVFVGFPPIAFPLGWEVFHWRFFINSLAIDLSIGLGGFSPTYDKVLHRLTIRFSLTLCHQCLCFPPQLSYWVRRLFNNSFPTIFRFSSSVSLWVRRPFINWSRVLPQLPHGLRRVSTTSGARLSSLDREDFFKPPSNIIYIRLHLPTRSSALAS